MNGWTTVAERQYGVITRAQLRMCLPDHRIHTLLARGDIERAYTGVFRVAGSYPSARQRAMAAVLWCGDDALLSHSTAAELMRLPAGVWTLLVRKAGYAETKFDVSVSSRDTVPITLTLKRP